MEIINSFNYKNKSIGKKAYNLFVLKENGINVPDLFCVNGNIKRDEIEKYLEKNYRNTNFAIRSSSSVEDSDTTSFAGQFTTFLNIPKKDVISKVYECSSSAFSEGLDRYIKEKQVSRDDIKINVIVQEMIVADKSGVVFTSNPQGILNESVIVLGKGTGNNVVEDKVNTTTYYYNRTDNLYYYEKQENSETLDSNEIEKIIDEIKKVEKILGKNLDIEFAIKDNIIYILQARKITTLNNDKKIVLDNSNIVESYPGISLPLTQSFVKEVYYQIMKSVLKRLTGDDKTVSNYDSTLKSMVSVTNGRIYYQINNWYNILKLLPFSKRIIPMWQNMLGVEDKEVDFNKNLSVSFKVKCAIVSNFFKAFKTTQKEMEELNIFFENIITKYHEDYSINMSTDELINLYETLKNQIMKKWDITLVNDMYAFIYTALVKRQLKKEHMPDYANISNRILSNVSNLESMKPIENLIDISIYVKKSNKILEFRNIKSNEDYYEYVSNLQDVALKDKLNNYIEEYGDRNLEELKLESKTFRTDPILLVNKIVKYAEDENLENYLEKGDYYKNNINLSLKVQEYLKKAEIGIRNREKSRLHRSKLYGIMRNIVLDIAKNFVNQDIISKKEDIFYLYYDEIVQAVKNKEENLKDIIEDRKHEYSMYSKLPAYSRIVFDGKIINKAHLNINNEEFNSSSNIICGIPCSSGKVVGEVVVINSSNISNIDVKGKILVTKMTDPGWVYLITQAKAVIAEKGSLLSHTAIIARELNKPTIVGVKNVTSILKDGERVEVDATIGKIRRLNG